ncbi:DUF2849 domain-containing protein [Thalassospiraceae bacterium LMO-JJ14]|nr:DUF2849 domain-containing protein [Thalassospiraceae bacterium LMO-JJ14]
MSVQLATANRLADGIVVFLGYDGEWTPHIDEARIAEREEDIAELVAEAEASPSVVGAYLIDAEIRLPEGQGRIVVPDSYREKIRAFGPSTHPAFAKKSVPEHFDPRTDVSAVFMDGI